MAMAKKGSRTIVVDGEKYRWKIAMSNSYLGGEQFESVMSLVVEAFERSASRLYVPMESSAQDVGKRFRGMVAYRPDGTALRVTPQLVTDLIRLAIERGWRPEAKDSTFEMSFHSKQQLGF